MKELLKRMNLRRMTKTSLALILALLISLSSLSMIWASANTDAVTYDCGLEEHSHSEACCASEPRCGLEEGVQYGAHSHSEGCFTDLLVCGLEESDEHSHNAECFVSELVCGYDEGENVPLGEHSHTAECYPLECGLAEHTHTDECVTAVDDEVLSPSDEIDADDEEHVLSSSDISGLSVSGTWDIGSDAGNENIAFNDIDKTATISHDENYSCELVEVRIHAEFPAEDGVTDRKLRITLAEGLVWYYNGTASLPDSVLESVSTLEGESTVYDTALGNGSYTYTFKDGVSSVDIDIIVRKTLLVDFPVINDAVSAEASCLIGDGRAAVTAAVDVSTNHDPAYLARSSNVTVNVVANDTVFSNDSPMTAHTYSLDAATSHDRLYDYAEVTLVAPDDITFVTAANRHISSYYANRNIGGWELESATDNGDGTISYLLRREGFCSPYVGVAPEWIIPSSYIGKSATVTAKDMKFRYYGSDDVCDFGLTSKIVYNVLSSEARNEEVATFDYNRTIEFDPDYPDAVYQLAGYTMHNIGTTASAPKIIEFEFDTERIGVTTVPLRVYKGCTIEKVWYRLSPDDEWTEAAVDERYGKNAFATQPAYSTNFVSNVELGLNEDDYFAAFRYEYDYLDDNGTPDDPSDDFRYGVPVGAKSAPNSSFYNPIAGVNLGLDSTNNTAVSRVRIYDKVGEDEVIVNDTGWKDLTTTYGEASYNYLQVVSAGEQISEAGSKMDFSATIGLAWPTQTTYPFCLSFVRYPVLYIRDETGEGISNVSLKNSSGVDILSEYPDYVTLALDHTETVDYNNDGKYAAVYKIDTSGLSRLSDRTARNAARIGANTPDGLINNLTVSYSVTTSSTYGDGSVLHRMSDAIFIENNDYDSLTNRNIRTSIADPYDVNNDGFTGESNILTPSSSYTTGTFMIVSRADISIATSAKKASDDVYSTWDGSDNYIQMDPASNYNIRSSVFNGSGVTTGTEDDKLTYIFIPVPKKGQQWGVLNSGIDTDGNPISTFAFDTALTAAVVNPDSEVYTIDYGVVDTSSFTASGSVSSVGEAIMNSNVVWDSNYADANCVRITVSGLEPSTAADNIVLTLEADENAEDDTVNIFSSIYYENITNIKNQTFIGWFSSDKLAMQITCAEISGRVWEDLNGDGIQDADEPGMAGVTVYALNVPNSTYDSTVTDANGEYYFSNLLAGRYALAFHNSRIADYVCSPKDAGSNDNIDSEGSFPSESNQNTVYVEITAFDIPFDDIMGNICYSAEHMDVGLTPYVSVSYDWGGNIPDSASLPESTEIPAGSSFTAAAVEPAVGYTFDGWYVDSNLTAEYTAGTVVTEDTTLYGKWTINRYTITFADTGDSTVESVTADYGSAVTAPADPSKTGYTFKGWDKAIPETMPAEDMTITALWEINKYTITFADTGNSTVEPFTADYGSAVTAPADPAKTGYTFKGWDKAIPETMPAEDMTITALWEINKYEITYVWSNAPASAVLPENNIVTYNSVYTAKTPGNVTGYTFEQWYTDGNCSIPYTDGTAITDDLTLYGVWSRNTVDISGSVTWVENGEGFTRPDSVTINLLRNDEVIDSVSIDKDETADVQTFSFDDLFEYDEAGSEKYVYTVEQETVPANYVVTQSGSNIVNTYNVNKYYIAVEWDHTGAPEDQKATESTVTLYRDDVGYKAMDFEDGEISSVTATVPRLEAAGHTFHISQNDIAGYETTYGDPQGVDTDNDGDIDAVYYTVSNKYIMPKITVSGKITWSDVPETPDGKIVPDTVIKVMLDGTPVGEPITISGGSAEGDFTYQFTGLDRYNSDGTPAEYTVAAQTLNYTPTYGEPTVDNDGNIAIDIANTGRFGKLTVSNKVVDAASEDDEFTFTITVGDNTVMRRARAAAMYRYDGTYSGYITAGIPLTVTLGNGESITIHGMPLNTNYSIVQDKHPDYYTVPESMTITGTVSSAASPAEFVNSLIPTGTLSITTKVTGDAADVNTEFEYKVTLDSDETFEYAVGETAGTVKSGDTITLKHGETASIYGIKEGTSYTVEQVSSNGYKTTSTGSSGTINLLGNSASFINTRNSAVAGGTSTPATGDYGTDEFAAIFAMHAALLIMLLCTRQLTRRREN